MNTPGRAPAGTFLPLLALAAVTSCSGPDVAGGAPEATGSTGRSAPTTSASSVPHAGTGSAPAARSRRKERAAPDACGFLSPTERSTAGLTSVGEPVTVGGSPACDYTEPGAFGVTLTLDERSGLAELAARSDSAEKVRIGSRAALRIADPAADDGTCSVLLSAGTGMRARSVHVDVAMADFQDTERACAHATTVAELIEPELS